MTCDEARELIEAVASEDIPMPPAFAAHVAACRQCAAAYETARAIERVLAAQPQPPAPGGFTRAVATAIRRQRWEYDEHVDRAFNLAVGLGIALIVVAVVGLLNASALSQLLMTAANAVSELPNQTPTWTEVRVAPMAGLGLTVMATAIAIWWWAERRSDFQQG